ncbi:MAG: glycosyltransferase family 39 protein [Phycisphaerales bacterium]|nr:MAG: glycosyltransferase family 39 protein [Phycisphaerales bacterium]
MADRRVISAKKTLLYGVLLVIVAMGAYVRLADAGQRPFWADEAWVAQAVRENSYLELFAQTELPMPPLYSIAIKLVGELVKPPELGLRLLPLCCSVACVPLSYVVVRRLRAPRTMALVATALVAANPLLVGSRDLKQYQIEALLSLTLAWLVFSYRRKEGASRWWFLFAPMLLVCLLGPWLGYGFVFPATAILGVLILLAPVAGGRRSCLVAGSLGLLVLGVSTLGVLQFVAWKQAAHPALIDFTENWYIHPLDLQAWQRAAGYGALTTTMTMVPFEWISEGGVPWVIVCGVAAPLMWILALVGLRGWPRPGGWEVGIWMLGSWLLMLGAAVAGQYPFAAPRMMAYWALAMALPLATGLVRLLRGITIVLTRRGGPGMVASLLLALLAVAHLPWVRAYWVYQDFPALLETLREQRRPGEIVIAAVMASPSVRYYAEPRDRAIILMPTAAGTCRVPDLDYNSLVSDSIPYGATRWWLLTTSRRREQMVLRMLETDLRRRYEYRLVAEAGEPSLFGLAQLYVVSRRR